MTGPAITGSMPTKTDNPAVPVTIFDRWALRPDMVWCAAGIGRDQTTVNEWAAAAGGHPRTGLKDNIRMDRDTLAPSNAALVQWAAEIVQRHGRRVASAAEAREVLGLRAA